MRKFNKIGLSGIKLISLSLICLFLVLSPYQTVAEDKDKNKNRTVVNKPQDDPFTTLIDINNITAYVQQNGQHPHQVAGSWSTTFPKGTAGGIYQEGMVWGGLVNDGQSPQLRVGGNTYFNGTDAIERIYRVRPDYETADLSEDAANFFYFQNYPLDAGQVTSGDISQLREQYEKDWMEWPADLGAPFEDVDGDGTYNPSVDIPGIPGASQTLWIYYNDDIAPNAYGSPPIGVEVQETYWAYSIANPLGNVIFKKVSLVYTGTENTIPNATIDDMYFVQWSDPDIGQYTDDFAGCDPELNLGYAYSSSTQDAIYAGLGLAPPAVGYDFLQGVSQYTGNPDDSAIVNLEWRKGYKYVHPPEQPMTIFTYFAAGGAWEDPDGQDPLGTPQWYNLMRGFLPRPQYPSGNPFPSNVGGTTTGGPGTYLLSGDPITRTGFVDGIAEGPGDRRIVCVHGPFNMALQDTVEVVLAIIGGIGSTNLSSVAVLKFNDTFAQYAFDQLFDLPIFPAPTVTSTVLDQKVVLNWDIDASEIENASPKGYSFQGYNIYQFPNSSFSLSEAERVATFDKVDNVTTILDDQFDESSGLILLLPAQLGTDAGLKRFIEIETDAVRNQPLRNGQEYYFGVTAYGYNPNLEGNLPFKALESSVVRLTVVPQQPTPGITYTTETGEGIEVTHANGTADGGPVVTIVDPGQTAGQNYEVFFTDRMEIRNEDGDWIPSSTLLRKTGSSGPDEPDTLTGTSIDISAVYGTVTGQKQLNCFLDLVSINFAWADGITMTFPTDVTIVQAPNFEAGGGVIAPEVVGNVINMGLVNHEYTENGIFHGDEEWTIIVDGDLPMSIDWIVYDDGYGGGPVDAEGTTVVESIGTLSRLAKYWNLRNVTSGELLLENEGVIDGTDIYPKRDDIPINLGTNAAPVIDGYQINMVVGYGAPIDFTDLAVDGEGSYDIDSYYANGWAVTAKAIDAFGAGTTVLEELQKDYELRFTGEYDDPTAGVVYVKEGTGSIATLYGARNYDLADHPMNPNPGSNDPFTVRIPFEVWSVDDERQINIIIYDRIQEAGVTEPFYAFNPIDRMYCYFLNTEYHENVVDINGPEVDNLTWNTVWWETDWQTGDVLTFTYPNPIQIGVDTYTFTTPVATTYSDASAREDIERINVFPNPYYGFHYREITRDQKYVTFSHLPEQATIRIFDLAGVLVRTIEKSDPDQFLRWNLQNDDNYPVASGIYIVYIDMPDLGTTKILKMAIIQEEQILRVY